MSRMVVGVEVAEAVCEAYDARVRPMYARMGRTAGSGHLGADLLLRHGAGAGGDAVEVVAVTRWADKAALLAAVASPEYASAMAALRPYITGDPPALDHLAVHRPPVAHL